MTTRGGEAGATRSPWRVLRPRVGLPVGLALAGGVAVALARQPWLRAGSVALSGNDLTGGLLGGLAWTVLAAALLHIELDGLGRRILGGVTALLGVGLVAVSLLHRDAEPHQWATRGVDPSVPVTSTGMVWGCLATGVVVVALGVLTAAVTLPRRRRGSRPGATVDDDKAMWDALSRGEDPTLTPQDTGLDEAAAGGDPGTPAAGEGSDTPGSDSRGPDSRGSDSAGSDLHASDR